MRAEAMRDYAGCCCYFIYASVAILLYAAMPCHTDIYNIIRRRYRHIVMIRRHTLRLPRRYAFDFLLFSSSPVITPMPLFAAATLLRAMPPALRYAS